MTDKDKPAEVEKEQRVAEYSHPGSKKDNDAKEHGITRRGLLGLGGAVAAGAVIGGAVAAGAIKASPELIGEDANKQEQMIYPFYGQIQAGITTPVQEHMYLASFDIKTNDRQEVIKLLQDWTYAANRLCQGLAVSARGAFDGNPGTPPADTGEAADHGANGLTLTFGFGETFFKSADGKDRFGIADKIPATFKPILRMSKDTLNPAKSNGDICVQACAHDPVVAAHAIRNLARIGLGKVAVRWSEIGFGRASTTSRSQKTPRNLFGQKDGTNNIRAEETQALDKHVWIKDSGQSWADGGTYFISRKIGMNIELWDSLHLEEQERLLGRFKGTGAPLSGGHEFTAPNFIAKDDKGEKVIDEKSHVARVHPVNNDGIRMLRRSYNYVDGTTQLGNMDAGLIFIAFINDPAKFSKVHRNMSRDDMFLEYLKTYSSGLFIVPPGIKEGEYIGQGIFS